ncbi:MAG: DUF3786 domain-containing protein [Bacillota bacterium]|nr:DUF3786 domain-containing protein [Bacillota bacterium]
MQYLETFLEAQREFAQHDPRRMAKASGTEYDVEENVIRVPYFNKMYKVSYPDGNIMAEEEPTDLTLEEKALILQYLSQAPGDPLTNRWISYSELPNGMYHDRPFKVEAVEPLAEIFGGQPGKLLEVAHTLGGRELMIGDVGVTIPAFPRILVAIILWVADEEFPARANIVFDAVTPKYLSTAAVYVLGSIITRRLKEAAA